MESVVNYVGQVKQALEKTLNHTGILKPVADFELYICALKLFLRKSHLDERMIFLNEAMHLIYCKKARSNLNWIDEVERMTYDSYNEVMN